MSRPIRDPEVRLLQSIAATLEESYVDRGADPWSASPFEWIRARPSRQVGKIGEQLVAGWSTAKGFDAIRSPDAEADRVIAGKRVEVKFSTLWKSGFQQFRDQRYAFAICLGLAPFDAWCWAISKDLLCRHVIGRTPQHRGAEGTDTFWLSVDPDEPPEWLRACGGGSPRSTRS